jgi:hypothetical protein
MRSPSKLIASPALVVVAAALAAAFPVCASAAAPPAMTVAVHPASGAASSYFTLIARAGHPANAGTLEVRNRRNQRIVVQLDAVGALTASTLGSAYATATPEPRGPAAWVRLPTRRLVLAPLQKAMIPVGVAPPPGLHPGDYLGGISVQALGQHQERRVRGNIAVASVQRYAVGLMVDVPGARSPLIRITSARVAREPAGLTFYMHATNAGNAILQNVHGRILVTRGRRTVARTKIRPGTFVTGTSIDYPLLVPREQPREDAVYRVRAVMRYHGGIARFDNLVKFGHAAAQAQEDFGGRPLTDGRAGTPMWLVVAGTMGALVGLLALLLFARRKRTPGERAARRALEAAIRHAARVHQPLSLVRILDSTGGTKARKLAGAVRARLRPNDRLFRLGKAELLVIMPATHGDAARLVCSDLQLPLSQTAGAGRVDIKVVEANGLRGAILLERLREDRLPLDEIEVSPEMIQPAWTSASKDEPLS